MSHNRLCDAVLAAVSTWLILTLATAQQKLPAASDQPAIGNSPSAKRTAWLNRGREAPAGSAAAALRLAALDLPWSPAAPVCIRSGFVALREVAGFFGFEYVDDVEQSAVKLRTFIDRVKTAPRGYAGLFDAVQVKEEQLDQLYNFDYQLLSEADNLAAAIDQCRVALGVIPAPPAAEGAAPAPTGLDALKAALNTVKRVCTGLNDLYDKRQHLLVGSL